MNRLLDPENRIFSAIGKLWDHLILGLLWLVCSVPVITVGAASAALSRVSMQILEGEEYRLFRDFFAAFRARFGLATGVWLAYLAVGLVLAWDCVFYYGLTGGESVWPDVTFGAFVALTLFYLVCLMWVFPYMARVSCGFKAAVKGSFLLGMTHLGYTVLMAVLNAALTLACLLLNFLLPFLPGLIAFADGLCLRRVFARYKKKSQPPEEDRAEQGAV